MKTVVIVNGPPRAGKDTFIEMVQRELLRRGIDTASFSSIEPIREMCGAMGIDVSKKTLADRKLLATIGDAVQEHSEYRTSRCLAHCHSFFWHRREGVFFLHIREPALIALIKASIAKTSGYPVLRVMVTSPRAEVITSNPSDAGAGTGPSDHLICNDGTLEQLNDVARKFVDQLDCQEI